MGDSGTRTVTTIGEDLTITGNVASKGEIHLDGHVKGDVHCGALVLGENSNLEGNVTADDVVIGGRLIGSVRAIRLILQSTSYVEGDLIHQSLAMEQGAFFEGKSRRSENPLSTNQTTAENLGQVSQNRWSKLQRSKRRSRKQRSCELCPNRTNVGSDVFV